MEFTCQIIFWKFEFWVVLIFKSALVITTGHQFKKIGLVLCMVFKQEFEFCVQNFSTSLLENSIFLHSEARLSSIMENWKKSLSFHYCKPMGVTNLKCLLLNFHTQNYHSRNIPKEDLLVVAKWQLNDIFPASVKMTGEWGSISQVKVYLLHVNLDFVICWPFVKLVTNSNLHSEAVNIFFLLAKWNLYGRYFYSQ